MILTCFSRSEPEIIIYNREKPRRDTLGTCADVFRGFGGSKTNFAFIFSSKSSKMVKNRSKMTILDDIEGKIKAKLVFDPQTPGKRQRTSPVYPCVVFHDYI